MTLFVAIDRRKGLLLQNHNLVVFLPGTNGSQVQEIVAKQLELQGVRPADHGRIVDEANAEYERRVKVEETVVELKRLMAIRADGGKLMRNGYRKWKQAFYRPVK